MIDGTPRMIKRVRLVDQVAEVLREMILAEELQPGERIQQDKLAPELGVSRTPLREALLKLEEEGLVRVSGTRGVEVIKLDRAELLQMYEVREFVDGLAARTAALTITTEQTGFLASVLDELASLVEHPDLHEWHVANLQFHESIVRMSNNRFVVQLLPYVRTSSKMIFPLLMANPHRFEANYRQHLTIFQAITGRDADMAELAARSHVSSMKEIIREHPRVRIHADS